MQRFDYAKYCYTPYYHYSLQGKQILYLGHPSCFISLFIRTQFCGCCRVIVCQSTIPSLSICQSIFNSFLLIIPHTSSCRGYNVFDPSISKSVSPSVRQSWFFFISATPLKPLIRISWNFAVMKDIHVEVHICRSFWFIFFLGVALLLNWEIWPKFKYWNILSAQILWNRSTEFRETL